MKSTDEINKLFESSISTPPLFTSLRIIGSNSSKFEKPFNISPERFLLPDQIPAVST
jgi:hypothetical protein